MNIRIDMLKWLRRKKVVLTLVAAGVLLTGIAGTTVAWLTADSQLSNTFETAEVTCKINETFEDGVKSNVSIRNTGTMDAYIRAALIPVWKDGGSVAGIPASLTDCTIDWSSVYGTSWVLGVDGYYYCTLPIQPGVDTPILIDECSALSSGSYRLELQISAQAVQALPASCVTQTWDSAVTGVLNNGTLEVSQ
jgi:hypothetical protein